MITNERQYRITKTQLKKLEQALSAITASNSEDRIQEDLLRKAELDALQSEIDVLSKQLHDYEALRSGDVAVPIGIDLEGLPLNLVRARIARGLTQKDLAERVGLKEQQIQRYESTDYLGASLNRLKEIASALQPTNNILADLSVEEPEPEMAKSPGDLEWNMFPIREMYKRGWLEGFSGSMSAAVNDAARLAEEFVTAILRKPTKSFHRKRIRSSTSIDEYALLAWECRVLSLASKKASPQLRFDEGLDERWLAEFVKESRFHDGPRRAEKRLREVGILLVVEPHLPRTGFDGAAVLYGDIRVVGMTLRYDRIDNFWFVLVHELVHIIKHLRRNRVESVFDDLESSNEEETEREADRIAAEALLPNSIWEESLARYVRSEESVLALASELQVSPAIVAGRIRHDADNYVILNQLVGQGEVRKQFKGVDFGVG